MMEHLIPILSILPEPQLKLWAELSSTPNHFILYGGTAIALRLGHRISIDFDFFSPEAFDPELLYKNTPYLKDSTIIQQTINTLTCRVDRQGDVLVSFFGGLNIGQITPPSLVESNSIFVASLNDLAGTKAAVIQKRVELKDYLDIDTLLTKGQITLEMILACGQGVYGNAFNPYITLKALCYFDDPELKALSSEIKNRLKNYVENVNIDRIPKLDRTPLGTQI